MILGITPTTIAVTGNNLDWGFEVGDQFHYHYSHSGANEEFDFYVEIDTIIPIADPTSTDINAFLFLGAFSYYFENGSALLTPVYGLRWLALPIGNWSLFSDLAISPGWGEGDGVVIIDTASEFGFSHSTTVLGNTETDSGTFSKADGVMNYYREAYQSSAGTWTMQIVREGYGTGIELYLVIGGVGAVVAVVGIIVFKKRR